MNYLTTDYHLSVMDTEVLKALNIKDNGIYVDATLGGGSHTRMILESNPTIKLYSFDQDQDAIAHNEHLLAKYPKRLTIFNDNFSHFRNYLAFEKIAKIDGIVFDLGVSQHQIKTAHRGLSFDLEGDLDMRMDQASKLTAYEIVNDYPVTDLADIFIKYGEEKEARRIARAIDFFRKEQVIKTTSDLVHIIEHNTIGHQKVKIKARVFQALRIYINREIEVLHQALSDAVNSLNQGGRVVVISYHSLEDRLVKQTFAEEAKGCICPHNFPHCICNKTSRLTLLSKKPLTPTNEEVLRNRQSRSAKLRFAEKK